MILFSFLYVQIPSSLVSLCVKFSKKEEGKKSRPRTVQAIANIPRKEATLNLKVDSLSCHHVAAIKRLGQNTPRRVWALDSGLWTACDTRLPLPGLAESRLDQRKNVTFCWKRLIKVIKNIFKFGNLSPRRCQRKKEIQRIRITDRYPQALSIIGAR